MGGLRQKSISFNGVTQTVFQWAKDMECEPRLLYQRLDDGWSIYDTLLTPIGESREK